jgi:hypothetical protein
LTVVLHRSCCSACEMVVAKAIRDGPDRIGELRGAREGLAHPTRNPLPQGRVKTCQVIGCAGLLRGGLGTLRRHHPWLGCLWIRMAGDRLRGDRRTMRPERWGTRPTPLPHRNRHEVARGGSQGPPAPGRVGLLRPAAPPLSRFRLQAGPPDRCGPGGARRLSGRGTSRNACDQTGPEPRATHASRTAAPAEREPLAPEMVARPALRGCQAAVEGVRGKLAAARLTRVRRCAMPRLAIFLVPVRSPSWARGSDDPGAGWPP